MTNKQLARELRDIGISLFDKTYDPNYKLLLDEASDRLENQSEWMSVDERLPETEGTYLVWNKEQKKIEIRFFHRLPPHYPVESHPEIREYFGNFADYKRITHWMPLPEAPKRKGGAE